MVIAVILLGPVITFTVINTPVDDKLTEVLAKPISSHVPNGQSVIEYYDQDNDGIKDELGYKDGTTVKPLADILNGSKLKFLAKPINKVVTKQMEKGASDVSVTYLNAIVSYLVAIILSIVAFLVLWIVSYVVVRVICYI